MSEPRTIAEVIARLTEIVERAEAGGSRLGYFPALYLKVTKRVEHEIRRGAFDDGERMERLDVKFANRYLEAFDRYRAGEPAARRGIRSLRNRARAADPDEFPSGWLRAAGLSGRSLVARPALDG